MTEDLLETLASFENDPYGFVIWAFPWGEGELVEKNGPEPWQEALLRDVGEGLLSVTRAIQLARTSGHGIGKSALVAWLILWGLTTRVGTRGVVTANTENQLKTRTWVELGKWYRLFLGRDYFLLTATRICARDPVWSDQWRIDQVPWSERNTEAFAGLHNKDRRILLIFDEASGIPDAIWETAEGAMTDASTQIIWAVFGNPNRHKGRFRDCFPGGKFAHRWRSAAVDSRTVSITNKEQIAQWIADYGEDHDFVRVRVRGVFPRVDAEAFISYEVALEATSREVEPQLGWPIVLGVDVGRFGDDPSVIYPRKGRDAQTNPPEVYPGIDTMALAMKIVQAVDRYKATMVFVDEGGVGGGVVDRLRQLQCPVIGVDFGAGPDGLGDVGTKYANKRAEIWGLMRQWLPTGKIVDSIRGMDISLVNELCGPAYGLNAKEAIQLESKKDMRRRGVPSPNIADALACTFAQPVWSVVDERRIAEVGPAVAPDYDPFSRERMVA